MINELDVSIGITKAKIPYNNEEEKLLIEKITKELNIEYNKIIAECNRIDEKILLFYLLFKTQAKFFQFKNIDDYFHGIFISLHTFLNEKNKNSQNEILVVLNIYKKIELNRKNINIPDNNFSGFDEQVIKDFILNLQNDVKSLEEGVDLIK